MIKRAAMAFLLLAGTLASPVHADDQRYGRIKIEVPGNWTLSLMDREEEAKGPYKFPWYENDRLNNYAQNLSWGKRLKSPAGSFTIWPVGGTDVKLLGKTGEDYELKGGTEYLVAFDYGNVGIKTFNHVFYLYCKEKSAFLVKVETKATGSTLKVNLLAQADHDMNIKKFKARKDDGYLLAVNGTLVKAKNNDNPLGCFISVKEKKKNAVAPLNPPPQASSFSSIPSLNR